MAACGTPQQVQPRADTSSKPAASAAAPAAAPTGAPAAAPPAVPATAPARQQVSPAPSAAAPAISPAALPGWDADALDGLRGAIAAQCALRTPPPPWPALCAEFAATDDLKAWIARRFAAWPLRNDDGRDAGLITGYYEPVLTGSRARERAGQTPIHRRPPDLVAGADPSKRERLADGRRTPYPARAEIETKQLLRGQELLWLDDAADAFFLQVQGSGRVRLRDGSLVRVGYADHNGQPYRAIGRDLVERGTLTLEQADAPGIKAWLRAHPAEAPAVMRLNPRYVFFREMPALPEGAGPPGSLGVPLTAMRSVATDPSRIPRGALMFLDATHPLDGSPLRRAVMSQDTGAAIVGTVRADLFWGTGEQAGEAAGRMRGTGRLWLLWPAGERPPGAAPGR